MKDSYIRKCWFCIVTILVLFLSIIFAEVYKALGTTIVLDSLDTSSTEYKVTKYSKYSVIEITEGGEYTLTQNNLNTVVNANIIVDSDEEVTLILDGINVKAGNYSQTSVFSSAVYGTAAISVQGDTDCKIVLKDDTVNTLTGYTEYNRYNRPVNNSFYHTAAISVENTIASGVVRLASLTIEGENGAASTGILNANGGNQSAAIGAGCNRLSGNITINSGIINAVSGDYGAAIGDGDTVQGGGARYDEVNGSFVWVVGETNSVATIEVNGGELWATATIDTPGIGTADNLVSGYHAEVDVWTGLQININGGVVVAIGGVQAYNPSSAIGPGSNTFVSSNNIVINKGEGDVPTEIIAVTRTDSGSYPVSNSGGDAIPVLSADSTASVLNVKFSEPKIARQLDFWYYVDPTYKTDTTSDFPNALLDRMGDIEVLGLAVLLPEGKYKISQDTDNDGADKNDPTLDEGLVVGGTGSITCDENYNGSVSCRYPLEIRSPSDLIVTHGDSVYFDVEVLQYSQGASLTYQWYVSTDAGSSWNLLGGANSERYDISEALISDSGNLYRCDVTESYYGENVVLSSLPAKLTVLREIEYEVDVNLLLDGSLYLDNNSSFELYDTNDTYIKDLELEDGVLNFAVTANTYRIYIDGEDVGVDFVIDADNTLYDINYYSVNLDVVSDNADDSVLINGTSYNSGNYSKALVLLSGNNINLSVLAVGESEVSNFTINSSNVDIDNLVSGYDVTVNSKTVIVVEFDYKEYDIDINVNLDNSVYTDVTGTFELKNDNTYTLNNTNGVLEGSVPAGTYVLYRDGEVIKEDIVISSTKLTSSVDYYSVNLELVSSRDLDSVVINDSTYVNNTKDRDIVLLAGESISVKAVPDDEMEVIKYTVNDVNDNISELLNTDTIVINETINLYVEFDVIEYSIKITNYLDNVVYSSLDGEFALYKGTSKVKDLTNTSGVLSTDIPAGSYKLYNGDDDLNIDIVVSSTNKEFRVDYYTVNLELVSPNNKNVVKIDDVEYTKSTTNNEIIVLSDTEVSIKAVPYNEMEITVFNINEITSDISELVKGYKINVNETKNIYVGFGIIAYNIKVTAYLDNEVYTNISGSFALYDQDNKFISNLDNNKGVLTGAFKAGIYYLYRDGNNTNVKVEVTSSDKEFRVDYYSVNLELVSPNNQDSVILGDNTYLDSVNNEIVLLSGGSISIKALPVSEMEVIKYTINDKDSDIEKLLGSYELSIKETTNIYVEFDIITYDIKITNYLDNKVYTNIPGEFALYSDNNKIINLTKKDGILSGNIAAGNYSLYKGDTNLGIGINVTSSNKEFRVDYYTVNLELVSPNDGDGIIIGENTYVDNMNGEIVLLSGNSINIKALPVSEMEVIKHTINDKDSDISKLLEGYNISVTEQTNIYVEFDIITYDISVTTYLDNSVYESIVGIFELRDSKGNKVSDLTNTNGVLNANIPAGSYNIYIDDEDIGESIEVTSSNKEFRIDYYTVNLDLVSPNSEDYVEINGACFKDSTTLNEIILLAGNRISLKGVPYEEMEVTKFTVNEVDSNINDLLNGYTININTKTDIYVRFDVIAYDIRINTYLDDSEYLDNSIVYSLYDNDGNLVDDMLNTGGVLTSDTEAGNYYLYENGTNTNIKVEVTSSNKEFKVDYYTVNLDLVSSNNNDSVIIGDNTYVDSMSGKIILLSGESINVKGVPDTEQEIIEYSINSNNGDINKLLGGTSIKVLEKTYIYVEFDIIEYPIKINVYLDDVKYTDVSHDYSLYKDGILFKKLNNNDGILNTDVPAGSYVVYEDGHSTGKSIVVTRDDKEFNLNYYTVNLEVVSPNDNDYVRINDRSYVDGTNEREIVVLEGDTISIEAVPYNEMEVKEYLVNEKDNEIADLLAGYNITIEEKTNIYVEFEIIEYPIKINTFLDGNSYDNLEGIFKLYDENGNKVSNLTKTDGVLTASLAAGTYYVYDEGVKTNYSIVVTDDDREFNMYYYTVNLVIDSKNDLNSVLINDVTYYDKTKDNEVVVLYGDSVNVKALVGEEMEIYEYTINNNSSDISSLMSGYDLKINNTTNLYVKFDDYRYTSVFNVYIDDESIEDLILVPEISFVRDNIQYTKDSKFTNGLYEVLLDGVSSDISINVNKGIVDVYFYNVSLVGDRGINTTNGNGLYLKDTDVSIESTLNAGFNFEGWYLGEELLDNGLSYNIRNISKKHDLTAKTVALAPYEPVVTPVNGYYDYGSLDTKVLELDVTPYEGTSIVSYQWYKCDELECNNKNLIEGATSDIFNPEDVNVNLYGYYCEVVILREDNGETLTTGSVVRLGIDPITPEISLDEKVEYFTGSEINIDDVLISNIVESDEFDVEYLYYLDEECTVLTSKANSGAIVDGGAPVNVGSYYVKVTVSGNSNYNEVSSISKVTILEVVVPPVEEEEDEKNPLTLDKIILVVVASILGIVVAIRCLPFVFKY